jgi:hypothetical protein
MMAPEENDSGSRRKSYRMLPGIMGACEARSLERERERDETLDACDLAFHDNKHPRWLAQLGYCR